MLRRPIHLLAVAVLAAACTPVGQGTTTTLPETTTTQPATTASTSTSTTAPETTTTEPVTPVEPIGIDELPEAIQATVVELTGITQQIRQLTFEEPPQVTVVSDAELADRVQESILEDTEDVDADQALYSTLGLLEPDTDLLQLYLDLYGEQVAGFYDGEAGELVIPAGGEELTPLQRATLVHELTHALTDQRLDVWDRYQPMIDEQRYDEATAFLSLIEGDAVLTEVLYIRDLPSDVQQELLAESFAADTEVFDRAPPFIRESLLFPYDAGFAFTRRLHDLGGFAEVDTAYREPPVSSEQVLHPRAYLRDEPLDVELPDTEPSGYELVYDSTWGELGFQLMFDQVLGPGVGDGAAEGWGGDRYRLWFDGTDVAMLLAYRGDTADDAAELADTLASFVEAGMAVDEPRDDTAEGVWTGDDYTSIATDGDRLVWVVASDPEIGAQLTEAGT